MLMEAERKVLFNALRNSEQDARNDIHSPLSKFVPAGVVKMYRAKGYDKCKKCGKVFAIECDKDKWLWVKHKVVCTLAASKVRHSVSTLTPKKTGERTPYRITNTLADYAHLPRLILENLNNYYLCVIDDYLSNTLAAGVRDEVITLFHPSRELFRPADTTIDSRDEPHRCTYRSDLIYWVRGEGRLTRHIKILKRSINLLVSSIEFLDTPQITHQTNFQISCYPKGSFGYRKHVDNPDNNGCLLTVVYYCNEKYDEEKDGGIHRFYIFDKKSVIDVKPKFNRVVIFWSDLRVVHGTLGCHRELFSLSSWYFNS